MEDLIRGSLILDNKCKMSPGEMNAIMAIYDVVHHLSTPLLGSAVHEVIRAMRAQAGDEVHATIHQLRIQAEAEIPKPVMKTNEVSFGEDLPSGCVGTKTNEVSFGGDSPSGYVGTKIAAFLRDGLFG